MQDDDGYSFGVYLDGNGDGVRTQDIQDAVDPRIGAVERLSDNFPGVDSGCCQGFPPSIAGERPRNRSHQTWRKQSVVLFAGRDIVLREPVHPRTGAHRNTSFACLATPAGSG